MIMAVMLTSIRIGAIFLFTPLFAIGNVPVKIRVLFILALSFMMVMLLNQHAPMINISVNDVIALSIYEALFGLTLAFGVFTAFAAFSLGGRILDFQMGFGVASLVDPVTSNQEPLLGTVLNIMAVVIFFIADGHHLLFKGIAYSFEMFPLGTLPDNLSVAHIIAQFGIIFTYGITLVAPAIFTLFLLDVVMAFSARTMPQVNMFILGIPLKILIGLSVLAVTIGHMVPLLHDIYMSIFTFWESVLS